MKHEHTTNHTTPAPLANSLILECRGCYFFENDESVNISDVGNYRIGAYENEIHAKNGRVYVLEFGRYDRRKTRYTRKRTNKPLKHPITEIETPCALHIRTQFEDDRGCWADLSLENQIHDKKLTYTKANILKVVNEISIKQYNKIILISDYAILDKISFIYNNLSGYRERAIIDNLCEIKTKQRDRDYLVFSFIDELGNTFDFEYNSNRITN